MSTTTYTDYINSIKNPQVSFADSELRQGYAVKHGNRYVISSGTSSLVFKFSTQRMSYALRCYTRDVPPDMHKRYELFRVFQRKYLTPFLIEVEFIQQGILVNGHWYPICKMPWIDGERLDQYLDRNYQNPFATFRLALQFLELTNNLSQIEFAHGNLAYDNILVVGEQIRLTGYDSVYVPDMKPHVSSALNSGHKNYQHPQRAINFFDKSLDYFSTIVIYLSLKAIEHKSEVYNQGATSLYFTRDDYLNPTKSDKIRLIQELGYSKAALIFKRICQQSPDLCPSLTEFIRMDSELYGELPASIRKQIGEPLTWPEFNTPLDESYTFQEQSSINLRVLQQPYLFISHSSVDNTFVDQLADELHRQGYRTFVDQHCSRFKLDE